MTPTPEGREVAALLERAADDIMCPNCISAKNYCDDCLSLKVELRKTAAALSVPAPEPVAWMTKHGETIPASVKESWPDLYETYTIPLYAAAPRERTEGEDSARLDWLERQARERESLLLGWNRADGDHNEFTGASCDWPESFFAIYEDQEGQPYATLRAAIDAARAGGSDVR